MAWAFASYPRERETEREIGVVGAGRDISHVITEAGVVRRVHSYEGPQAVPARPYGKGSKVNTLRSEEGKLMRSELLTVCSRGNKSSICPACCVSGAAL